MSEKQPTNTSKHTTRFITIASSDFLDCNNYARQYNDNNDNYTGSNSN